MPGILDDVDVGGSFEAHYPDVRRVTVTSIDPLSGAALAAATDVAAAPLVEGRATTGARGGEVGVTTCDWWVRSDQLGFTLKARDTLTEEGGRVWVVGDVEEFAGLAKCPGCVLKR